MIDQERPLEPPDDVIDYDRDEERIEEARAEEADKAFFQAIVDKDVTALATLLRPK